MADLFEANLQILALKEELKNLKEKVLADNLGGGATKDVIQNQLNQSWFPIA